MTILGSFTILLFTAWLPAPGWCLGTESSLLEVKVDRSLLWENDSFIDAPLHEILKYLQILHAGFTLDKCWLVHPCTVWWMTISRRWILSRYLGIVTCYSPRSRHWPGWRASGHSRAWVPTSCGLAALCSAMEHYCYIIAATLGPISWQIARRRAVTRAVNEISRNIHNIRRSYYPTSYYLLRHYTKCCTIFSSRHFLGDTIQNLALC